MTGLARLRTDKFGRAGGRRTRHALLHLLSGVFFRRSGELAGQECSGKKDHGAKQGACLMRRVHMKRIHTTPFVRVDRSRAGASTHKHHALTWPGQLWRCGLRITEG